VLPSRDLVLVGAGHTNLHVVRMWRMHKIPDVRLTVVSPYSRATYSGMLPGTLAGLYEPGEMEIDLHRLAESAGARLIIDEAIGIAPEIRRVLFARRPPLRFDVASIGIGSIPGQRELWSNNPRVLSVKPMATFRQRLERLVDALAPSDGRERGAPLHVVVVGAGAGGTELAFSLDAWLGRMGLPAKVTIIDAQPEILPGYSPGTIDRVRREFDRRGVAILVGRKVLSVSAPGEKRDRHLAGTDRAGGSSAAAGASPLFHAAREGEAAEKGDRHLQGSVRPGVATASTGASPLFQLAPRDEGVTLVFADGSTLPADLVVWATAAAPAPVLANYGLPKSGDGFLEVRPTLKTTADYPVFAVGDTASIVGCPLPRAGVYAVREGRILWENILRTFSGRELVDYQPQRGFLSLLATGDGRAIVEYKGLSGHGTWAWRWKNHIDRKFMRMYQDYSLTMPPGSGLNGEEMGARNGQATAMRCAGCGSKVGSRVLAAALERLNLPPDPRTRVGLAQPDDAAVLDREQAPVDVLSVDFFTAFLDDPYLVGRIAALNALSDLWAMGSTPVGAMAVVTLPEGSQVQQTELLYQLLAGGLRELADAGASLWGGHTIEGAELTIGYTVAGKLDGHPPFAKGNLRPGDRLLLTKPLGTATLLAAYRQALCPACYIDGLLSQMLASNAAAAKLAREWGVTAVTDVTGFGLAGHLLEMLDASRVSARLALAALPVLDGFAEMSRLGVKSSLDPANRAAEPRLATANQALRATPAWQVLFDPQTSGGLLIAVAADSADEFARALHASGVAAATVVGEVVPLTSESPTIEIVEE
jgi:selenide,water dikinase